MFLNHRTSLDLIVTVFFSGIVREAAEMIEYVIEFAVMSLVYAEYTSFLHFKTLTKGQ